MISVLGKAEEDYQATKTEHKTAKVEKEGLE